MSHAVHLSCCVLLRSAACSCYLVRDPIINSHDKVLSASVPSDVLTLHQMLSWMTAGVVLAGRLYEVLTFKDNKVYFVASASVAAGDNLDAAGFPSPASLKPGAAPQLTPGTFIGLEPAQVRGMLGAFRTIDHQTSVGKIHARLELLLSQTVPIPGVPSANIRYFDDIYGRCVVAAPRSC